VTTDPPNTSYTTTEMSTSTPIPFPPAQLLALVDALSPEELELLRAKLSVAPAPAKKAARPSAAAGGGGVRPKKGAAVVWGPLPEPDEGEEPDASAYRIAAPVDGVCDGRRFNDGDPTTVDRRWKPAVYRELQCGGVITEDGLCATCLRRREKYAAEPSPKVGWLGRLSEEPPEWCHMLGTAWATEKKPVFGAGSAASSEVSVASAAAKASAVAAEKAQKAAAKAAEKAQKAAAKAAEKAAKAAAKEETKAQREAEKAAAAAVRAAEKEAKRAAQAAAKKPAPKKAAAGGGGAEAKEKED
jgi:hypothetical protein